MAYQKVDPELKKKHYYQLGLKLMKDMTGMVFGMRRVIKRVPRHKYSKHVDWWCECECGRIDEVDGPNLRRGVGWACHSCAMQRAKARQYGREFVVKKLSPMRRERELRKLE